jgi:hypothetical protein
MRHLILLFLAICAGLPARGQDALEALLLIPLGVEGVDADALIWQTNVVSSGGSVSAGTLTAVSRFCNAAKGNQYWTKLTVVCPVAGTGIASAKHYLKYVGSVTNAVASGTAMTYNETGGSGGVVGNGTDAYWDTQYNPNGSSTSSFSVWAWCHTASAGGATRITLGNQTGASDAVFLGFVLGGTQESGLIAGEPGTEYTGTAAASTGFIGVNVSGSRSCQWYKNGIATGSPVTQTHNFPNRNIFFNACNVDGSASYFETRRTSFWVVATGLTAQNIIDLYNDVLAFQTALTRN